ncbi:MAG: hypothetical protein V1838_00035 [Patescibacteria group bacterium]
MEIPLVILLYIFLALVGLFVVFSFFDLYHVIRFGFLNGATITAAFIFIAGAAMILFISYQQLQPIDWSETILIGLPIEL